MTNALSSFKADLIISASFGQKIPIELINNCILRGLNIHPSLLPRWRGADPVPWAILTGDQQTGVTIITLEQKFDQGQILAQQKILIKSDDYADPLRTRLFEIGGDLFTEKINDFINGKIKLTKQNIDFETYARKLHREDGFIPWQIIINSQNDIDTPRDQRIGLTTISEEHCSLIIERMHRALSPWPGIFTKFDISGTEKRLKILKLHIVGQKLFLDEVQLEGKNPVLWQQFSEAYKIS